MKRAECSLRTGHRLAEKYIYGADYQNGNCRYREPIPWLLVIDIGITDGGTGPKSLTTFERGWRIRYFNVEGP